MAPASSAPERPPPALNGAEWINSDAKRLMVQDMMDGIVPVNERIKNYRKLYDELYAHQPEFEDFPFDTERYRSRIIRLQDNVRRMKWASDYDQKCLEEARLVYPKETHGPTGTILWRDSEADNWLEIDMAAGLHLQMKPSELRQTRECYKLFTPKRFSKRIDQKKEAAKPYGMNPMQAAAKKEKKERTKVMNRPQISRATTTEKYNNTKWKKK